MALIETRDLWKTYVMGSEEIHALRGVSLEIEPGEYVAIMGPSGSGKSTLMKILSGVYRADEGTILYKGKEVAFTDVLQARNAGIGIIYQELNLIPDLSVAANIFIGREPLTRSGTLDEKKMNTVAVAILAALCVILGVRWRRFAPSPNRA